MKMEKLVVPKEINFERTRYVVYYMIKGHNCWHIENECVDYDKAYNLCLDLESKCECFTEIRVIKEQTKIYKFYDYYPEEV